MYDVCSGYVSGTGELVEYLENYGNVGKYSPNYGNCGGCGILQGNLVNCLVLEHCRLCSLIFHKFCVCTWCLLIRKYFGNSERAWLVFLLSKDMFMSKGGDVFIYCLALQRFEVLKLRPLKNT